MQNGRAIPNDLMYELILSSLILAADSEPQGAATSLGLKLFLGRYPRSKASLATGQAVK